MQETSRWEPPSRGAPITIIKRNLENQETWRYSGQVLEMSGNRITIEAFFNRPDLPFHGIVLKHNDRFVETFFTDRWYNVFAIHDRDDNSLKGWYCNITRPAVLENQDSRSFILSYVDLALDLLVFPPDAAHPHGRQLVLDEDEFLALDLDPDLRRQARQALIDLQKLFRSQVWDLHEG